jgi:hypothetical protein
MKYKVLLLVISTEIKRTTFFAQRWGGQQNAIQIYRFFLQIFLCRKRAFVTYKSHQRIARAPCDTVPVPLISNSPTRESSASAVCGADLMTGASATDEALG